MNIKNSIIWIIIVILYCSNILYAQQVAKNTLYLEGIGIGGYGSVNYERSIIQKNNINLMARIGFGTYHILDYTNRFNPDIIIPIAINATYGKQHHIEFGIGHTIASTVYVCDYL